jgi:hypothetical protein
MSLQFDQHLTNYATVCASLWTPWRATSEIACVNVLLNALRACTNTFLPAINYGNYNNNRLEDYGVTYPHLWRIDINVYHATKLNLPLYQFLEWVTTPFHETRHAEQTYRVIQGVLAGEIEMPGETIHRRTQRALKGKRPGDIVRALESQRPFDVIDADTRKNILKDWLREKKGRTPIPDVVIDHADINRDDFANYCLSGAPSWYDRRGPGAVKSAVIDWMNFTWHPITGEELDRRAQAGLGGFQRMYRTTPEEKDAYGIERVVQGKILALLGKTREANGNDTPPP